MAGTEYERSLAALPEASRKALLLGRWDCFEGAVFSEWNYRIHTCNPFPSPVTWDLWRGCDDGYKSPACVLWCADDGDGHIFVLQELYQRGLTPSAMAHEVLAMDKEIPIYYGPEDVEPNDLPLSGVVDSASFADIGLGNESGRGGRAEIMNRLGCKWEPSAKGAGSRVAGLAAIHSRLALQRDGRPGLVIFRTCRNLIRTLPSLPYSTRNPEDLDSDAEDHCVDALRYSLTRVKHFFRSARVTGL